MRPDSRVGTISIELYVSIGVLCLELDCKEELFFWPFRRLKNVFLFDYRHF